MNTYQSAFILRRNEDPAYIEDYRRRYLNSLPFFQELFIEILVREGFFYEILLGEKSLGYIIINNNNTHLIEYYSGDDNLIYNQEILEYAVKTLNLTGAYCKTFDYRLNTALNLCFPKMKVDGILFRKYRKNKNNETDSDIQERAALPKDLDCIKAINDGFFESNAEIETYLENGNILLFEGRDGQLLGCGLYQRIAYDYKYYDLGMLVNPNYRNRGYGNYIVKRLISFIEHTGNIPICGCGANNIASLKTLEKAGFVPEHEILEYLL